MKALEGSIVALATPFRNGVLDEEAYARLVKYQLDNGTSGLVPVGTTGEAATLSAAERVACVKQVVALAQGKVPVIAGAGSHNTVETVEAVGRMRDAGADAALVVTPYYNKPTQVGLVAHFRAIAQAHPGFPLVVYNVPSRTGVDFQPDAFARLMDLREVVAIKEATGNMARAIDLLERCQDKVSLLSGDDFTVLPFVACGGKGVISVSANVAPRMLAELVADARAGRLEKAQRTQVRLNGLHGLLFAESNPIPVKWALHCLRLCGPELRLPLTTVSPELGRRIEAELEKLGLRA
jgi:4-hydroxy-tetrahydrodipicolinate synthase